MGYRSIKRVLGETSLERKCRLLFGTCLLILISGAFWWVDSIAEDLVIQRTRSTGQDLVDVVMIKSHGLTWATKDERARDLFRQLVEEFEGRNYEHKVVTMNARDRMAKIENFATPRDAEEVRLLRELEEKVLERKALELAAAATGPPDPADAAAAPAKATPEKIFVDRRLPELDQYHYYEPVNWKTDCLSCHKNYMDLGVFSPSETSNLYAAEPPLYAVKVIIPYKETHDAINRARAILIAVAILTVFVAMIGLYVIVRYVVVKPLKHLRDVSDEVSRGKLEVRAEVYTNDEFQELAESFNRMLRHLTDAQTELRRVNEDLDAKVDELAQLNMRLYEMNRLKGDFLANMSHELRTPLNSIIGFSEVLQGIDSLNDKQKRYAVNIQKSGRLLLEMINDILDLAKLEAGKMEIRPSEFRIDLLVQAQCDMVRALAEDKNIDLEAQVDEALPPLFQDQAKVQQILTNLLSNAIKFTPEGGRITVRAQCDEHQHLELTVADTGVGIAEEDREIVFEKFRQSSVVLGDDGLTREYAGTGLGLSIIKELCKLLGGEISFESELGMGSTFKVVLPWTQPAQSERQQKVASRLDELTRPQLNHFATAQGSANPTAQ